MWGYLQYRGDTFSTVEVVQYSGGITSVQWGDSFSTVEGIQYIGGSLECFDPGQRQSTMVYVSLATGGNKCTGNSWTLKVSCDWIKTSLLFLMITSPESDKLCDTLR